MILNQDFREFIQSLNENNVRFLVVGGYAVAFHGHPRYTKDLDVWIEINPDNAQRLIQALEQFGFASLELIPNDFLEWGMIVQLGYPPNRIDLIMGLAGVDFEECYDKRMITDVGGVVVPFIDLENLRRNKQTVGRLQDLADLENLA
jgi:hypothetical protein